MVDNPGQLSGVGLEGDSRGWVRYTHIPYVLVYVCAISHEKTVKMGDDYFKICTKPFL